MLRPAQAGRICCTPLLTVCPHACPALILPDQVVEPQAAAVKVEEAKAQAAADAAKAIKDECVADLAEVSGEGGGGRGGASALGPSRARSRQAPCMRCQI
jgi:hypothetical protein